MDSDEKGIFLLSLTAITEERMVEIFLHPDQKPEGNTAKPPIWSPLLSLKVIQPNLPCGHLY